MSEKIIDEVVELVTSLWDSGNARESWDLQCAKYEAIRAKLREVLERKPMTDKQRQSIWSGCVLEHDETKDIVKSFGERVEKFHGIGT